MRTDFAKMIFKMKDGKPIIILWCAVAILLAAVVVVRMIHKRGEPPLSAMKEIYDSKGLLAAVTISNRPVATLVYGSDTNGQNTNLITHRYDANGQEMTDTNVSSPSGK